MKILRLILFFFLMAGAGWAFGQKQLVLIKKERVLLRLYPGDEIVFKLKGSQRKVTTYVNNLSDTAVVTHRDTIPYHTIDRIYFHQPKFYNKVGTALVVIGGALFLIDQINVVLVNGQSPSLDDWVTKVTLTSLAIGIPAMLIKKKSQRLNYRYRLRMVTKGSIFYRPDSRGYISPYMDN